MTDDLRSYGAALKEIGTADGWQSGRWLNNRAENSYLSFRRRERAMQRFQRMRTLEKFASVHASVTSLFNQERIRSPTHLQCQPRRSSRRVARPLRSIGGSVSVLDETRSNWSETSNWTTRWGSDQRVRRAEVTSSGSRIVGGSGSIGQSIEAVPKRGQRHWREEVAPDA